MQAEEGVGRNRQHRNAFSNPKQEDAGDNKAELIQNPDKNKDGILSPYEDYKKSSPDLFGPKIHLPT